MRTRFKSKSKFLCLIFSKCQKSTVISYLCRNIDVSAAVFQHFMYHTRRSGTTWNVEQSATTIWNVYYLVLVIRTRMSKYHIGVLWCSAVTLAVRVVDTNQCHGWSFSTKGSHNLGPSGYLAFSTDEVKGGLVYCMWLEIYLLHYLCNVWLYPDPKPCLGCKRGNFYLLLVLVTQAIVFSLTGSNSFAMWISYCQNIDSNSKPR